MAKAKGSILFIRGMAPSTTCIAGCKLIFPFIEVMLTGFSPQHLPSPRAHSTNLKRTSSYLME